MVDISKLVGGGPHDNTERIVKSLRGMLLGGGEVRGLGQWRPLTCMICLI